MKLNPNSPAQIAAIVAAASAFVICCLGRVLVFKQFASADGHVTLVAIKIAGSLRRGLASTDVLRIVAPLSREDVADTIELVAGWTVAGLVTTGGVLLAQWVQERSRRKREDRLGIYEPLRRGMVVILFQPDRAPGGGWIWGGGRDGVSSILSRAAL